MAKFSVYPNLEGGGYLIDVQADLMRHLNTRMVIPLLPLDVAPKPAKTLNPLFDISGTTHSMVTQYMTAVHVKALRDVIFTAESRRNDIVAAIDLVLHGF
jgi:toxin CcdB